MSTKNTIRKELLKLSRPQLIKRCKVAKVASNGTKNDMIDRIINKNGTKKRSNKNKSKSQSSSIKNKATQIPLKSSVLQPNKKKIFSTANIVDKKVYLVLSYYVRLYKIYSIFPKEISMMIVDYSLSGYFHPDDHQNIRISNNGLTASNKAQNGYSTILFGFPFERSIKSVRNQNQKKFKHIYVIKFRIDKLSNANDCVAIAFVPQNYNLFNGAPDMLDGAYVLYCDGIQFGWKGNRIGEVNQFHFQQENVKIIIKIDLRNKLATILKKYPKKEITVKLPKDKRNKNKQHDIIRLAFVLNSPLMDMYDKKKSTKAQITVTDQYWE